jgi:predicted metalloprotease with PDZ domain
LTVANDSSIRYRIVPIDPHAHLFEVACTVADPDAAGQRFRLPVWIPGSYLIREFSRHFVSVRAEAAGVAVGITKEAKDLWRAEPCAGPLTVTATVYAFDLSVRTAYFDSTRAYFNGPSVFLCPEGRADARCEVEILPPPGDACGSWRVATTLPSAGAAPFGFGNYAAANYDELIDHPVEMADFARVSFIAGDATHDIAITGRAPADLDRLARDLARVCQWQIDLFGGAAGSAAPFDRYLFQVAAVGDGYGGLEHRSSTSLLCKRDDLPAAGTSTIGDGYRSFLGLASHEYFHSWNIKRIKPAAFTPYDLGRENYTRQLWAFEGITSYYDELALVRSGVIDRASYLELVGRAITSVLRNPGRHVQSVSDSSFDAWIKYYRQDENTPNAVVSYYVKGSLVALALDLTLRRRDRSLDELMRALWLRFGTTGTGVPEDGLERLACELGGPAIADFFARHVHGLEDPPLAELLREAGLSLQMRVSEGAADRGGKAGVAAGAPRTWLGAAIKGGAEPRLAHVYRGGPAEAAGLAAGDVVIAIDGIRATADGLEKLMLRRRAGDTLTVHAFRRDELQVTALILAAAPENTCWIAVDSMAGDAERARRDGWLGDETTESPRH